MLTRDGGDKNPKQIKQNRPHNRVLPDVFFERMTLQLSQQEQYQNPKQNGLCWNKQTETVRILFDVDRKRSEQCQGEIGPLRVSNRAVHREQTYGRKCEIRFVDPN